MDFIPITEKQKAEMLKQLGLRQAEDLFDVIPQKARIKGLNLPKGMSENSLLKEFEGLSGKNSSLKDYACFLGAGVYDHFIPSLVEEMGGRSEFSTAYTPYQPEASQGTLQAIFEYQSLLCKLTGMEVANASLYDGASALAEAALLAVRATNKKKIVVSSAVHPEYRQVLQTYLKPTGISIVTLPYDNGATIEPSKGLGLDSACLIIQSPNFFGVIEDMDSFKAAAKSSNALLIEIVNPVSLGMLKSPGEIGVDIAVGEGQALGNPTGFGGFGFGFLTAKKEFSWKMPGRIVGQTVDKDGKRGFVLTLQSREQHIRREKATSNICTNAALNALLGCVYLSGMGPEGLRQIADANIRNSGYAFEKISGIPGFKPLFGKKPFFNEFAFKTTKNIDALKNKLLSEKIIGPLELGRFYPELKDSLLFCVTEKRTKQDIDKLVNVLSN
jgi:glycine dehydrogenase subunit 1